MWVYGYEEGVEKGPGVAREDEEVAVDGDEENEDWREGVGRCRFWGGRGWGRGGVVDASKGRLRDIAGKRESDGGELELFGFFYINDRGAHSRVHVTVIHSGQAPQGAGCLPCVQQRSTLENVKA